MSLIVEFKSLIKSNTLQVLVNTISLTVATQYKHNSIYKLITECASLLKNSIHKINLFCRLPITAADEIEIT